MTPDGQRKLSVVLKDSQGQPISNASVQLEFYHHAHARDSQVVTIPSSSEPGRYTSVLPMRYAGFWQFDLRASAGDQLFAAVLQLVPTGKALRLQVHLSAGDDCG